MLSVHKILFTLAVMTSCIFNSQAALIFFTDRTEFENAVNGGLAFDGFNDRDLTTIGISTTSNFNPYRTTTSHVSEGDSALSIFERDTLTIEFGYDVFAIGFDLNELNSNNLTYSDSAGHLIADALLVTDVWNESTFFGVISDTAITSFSLIGNGDQGQRSTYGFDALSYTAQTVEVSEPEPFAILIAGIVILVGLRFRAK